MISNESSQELFVQIQSRKTKKNNEIIMQDKEDKTRQNKRTAETTSKHGDKRAFSVCAVNIDATKGQKTVDAVKYWKLKRGVIE